MRREERLDDPQESLRLAMEGQQSQMWTALPGVVSDVDLVAQTVSVQPTIQSNVLDSAGQTTPATLPLLVDVPIVWPRAGGFALTFPVADGDEVLVVFASRCIDSWWQSGGVGQQAEDRMHDLSDGFAILAPSSQPKRFENVSTENVQLRNEGGDTFIEITPAGKIRLVATDSVEIEAPSVVISADSVNVDSGSITLGGIVWADHVHGGVATGTATTSVPE